MQVGIADQSHPIAGSSGSDWHDSCRLCTSLAFKTERLGGEIRSVPPTGRTVVT